MVDAPPRHYLSEDNLAQRVKQERQTLGWSQETLAQFMTNLGVKMHQSSIAKIENLGPRRRPVTVDEAIGFAAIFDIPLPDLLRSPEAARSEFVAQLEETITARRHQVELAQKDLDDCVRLVTKVRGSGGHGQHCLCAACDQQAGWHDEAMCADCEPA